MYSERIKNIPVFRGCSFNCCYCNFKRLVQLNKGCPNCATFTPHSHMEALQRGPPKTEKSTFVTVGLSGDVSFMYPSDFLEVLKYCYQSVHTTFMIQSKNPKYFLQFKNIPDNVIIGTTIETNRYYLSRGLGDLVYYTKNSDGHGISNAPPPESRYNAMIKLECRKAITIEPILLFDIEELENWICRIQPEILYIGYNSNPRIRLPEPELQKTYALIDRLRRNTYGTIRIKTLRPAWWEPNNESHNQEP